MVYNVISDLYMKYLMIGSLIEILENIDAFSESLLNSLGMWGAVLSCFLITIESIVPILPLCVFVTFNFFTFGNILGFLISWAFTIIGCMLSFMLFRTKVRSWFERKILNGKNGSDIKKIMNFIDKITLPGLATLVAIPFTPAFAVNIAAGLSNISKKKFLAGILIGKTFMVYFWGYIGTTLIESLTHPIYLVRILIMLGIAYVISKIVNKHFNLD